MRKAKILALDVGLSQDETNKLGGKSAVEEERNYLVEEVSEGGQ